MLNQQNQLDQQDQQIDTILEFIDPNQINMGIELVGWPNIYGGETKACDVKALPQVMGDPSYADFNQHDHNPDELCYHNAGTCPACGQGMMQVGDQLACPNCGV